MNKSRKGTYTTFFIIFFTAVGFAIAGMLFPPPGQIDNSLLILIAQFLVLAAGVFGLGLHVDVHKGKVDAGRHLPEDTEDE